MSVGGIRGSRLAFRSRVARIPTTRIADSKVGRGTNPRIGTCWAPVVCRARPFDLPDPGLPIEGLEQVVGGLLDGLVAPLGRAVQDRDDPGAVDPPEVAEDERIAGLGLVGGALRQA